MTPRLRGWRSTLYGAFYILMWSMVMAAVRLDLIGAAKVGMMGAAGSGGDVRTYVGDFTSQNSAGTQDITTYGSGSTLPDLSAAPAGSWALIVSRAGSQTTSGTWQGSVNAGVGFAANGGGSIASYCVSAMSLDAQATSISGRRMAAKLISTIYTNGDPYDEADLTSMLSGGGFRLTWSHTAGLGTYKVNFILITGLTGAKVTQHDTSGTGTKNLTGAGFSPDLCLIAGMWDNGTVPYSDPMAYFSFGAVNAAGEQWANSFFSYDAQADSNTSRWQRTDSCFLSVNANETASVRASGAVQADGLDLNFASAAYGTNIIVLHMDGIASKIGSFTKQAGTGVQTVTSSHSFTVKGALFSEYGTSSGGAPTSFALWSLGATDGTNNRVSALSDNDGAATTNAKSMWRNDALITRGASGTTNYVAAWSTSTTSDFGVNFTANDGTGGDILYLLVGAP